MKLDFTDKECLRMIAGDVSDSTCPLLEGMIRVRAEYLREQGAGITDEMVEGAIREFHRIYGDDDPIDISKNL
jgi:hypothetical protein